MLAILASDSGAIPSYARVDVRFGWRRDGLALSLVGQNLLDSSHKETEDDAIQLSSEVPRSLHGILTLQF